MRSRACGVLVVGQRGVWQGADGRAGVKDDGAHPKVAGGLLGGEFKGGSDIGAQRRRAVATLSSVKSHRVTARTVGLGDFEGWAEDLELGAFHAVFLFM